MDPDKAWDWTLPEFVLCSQVAREGFRISDRGYVDREWGEGLVEHLRAKGIKV